MEPRKIYLSIPVFAEKFKETGWITYNSLRELRRNCDKNGFNDAFILVGKRVLVDVNVFWEIVENQKRGK